MSRILTPTPTQGRAPSHAPPDMQYAPGAGLANFLGWFGIGLGLAELAAPQQFAKAIGAPERPVLTALMGVREIVNGIGVLATGRPTGWMWGRVAGDALDLALLGSAFVSPEANRARVATAVVAVAGVAILDAVCSAQLTAAAALEG